MDFELILVDTWNQYTKVDEYCHLHILSVTKTLKCLNLKPEKKSKDWDSVDFRFSLKCAKDW